MGRVVPEQLEAFKVGSLPSVFYIPDYLSPDHQQRLLNQINVGARTKWKSLKNRRLQNWGGVVHEKGLLPQQLPPWLSELTGNICKDLGLYPSPINHVLINEYLPGQGIMPHQDGPAYFPVVAILSLGSPVVMEFTPHQRLLEMHGEGDSPVTTDEALSVILMPGSLLVFKDAAYQDFLHGIDECIEHKVDKRTVNMDKLQPNVAELLHVQVPREMPGDSIEDGGQNPSGLEHDEEGARKDILGVVKRNGTRVSLTCRLVSKVHKNLFRI